MKNTSSIVLCFLVTFSVHAQLSHTELDRAWQRTTEKHWIVQEQRFPFQQCFEKAALQYELPLSLLLALARGESSFREDVVSKANAIGIMQIQWPGTAQSLGITSRQELFKPCVNIDAGARYFRRLLDRFDQNAHRALAAYNYGPTRIAASDRLPEGALWYSEYILDHHDIVMQLSELSDEASNTVEFLDVLTFNQPYRAKAMSEALANRYLALSFDWYALNNDEFVVRVLVNSQYQGEMARRQLSYLGLSI